MYATIRFADRECDDLKVAEHGTQISCCRPHFERDRKYPVEVDLYSSVRSDGSIAVTFCAEIFNGSVDGYDRPSGVRYTSAEEASADFTLSEE